MSDPFTFRAEGLGISSTEAKLAIQKSNGVPLDLASLNPPAYLAGHFAAAAMSSAEDHECFGIDLDFVSGDSSQLPQEIMALSAKVAAMSSEQAAAFMGYIVGFWNGIDTASQL